MKISLVVLASVLLITSVIGIALAAQGQPPLTVPTSASVDVNEFISVTLTSGSPITFGNVDPDGVAHPATNGPLVISVGSDTNINYEITTASDTEYFNDPDTVLEDGALAWSNGGAYTPYTTTPAQVATGGPGGGIHNLDHQITIPTGTPADTYSLGITITAAKI